MSEEKKKERRKKRRRLSEEEREKLRRRALLLKAIQFKRITDIAILVSLALVLLSTLLPLIHVEVGQAELKLTSWQVVFGRETATGKHGLLTDGTVYARLTASKEIARGRGRTVEPYKVPWYGFAFAGIYPVAALLVLLYLLDLAVSLGRPLPIASCLFGLFTLGYMLFMVMFGGPFNEFRSYSLLALLLGALALVLVSLLRLPNSSRRRRAMLRAAKRDEPLDPFFAPAVEEKGAPAEAEKKDEEAEKTEAAEIPPEEERERAEETKGSEEAGEQASPGEAGGEQRPPEETGPEEASED